MISIIDAAKKGDTVNILHALKHGDSVDSTDEFQRTALMIAIYYEHIDAVRVLLSSGANVKKEDINSWKAITYACNRKSHRYTMENPWTTNREYSDIKLLEILLNAGGVLSLREAVLLNDRNLVDQIMKNQDTDINLSADWLCADTYMMVACDLGFIEIVDALLKYGARVDEEDDLGEKALMRAAGAGHQAIIQLLLEHGADINATDWSGVTALAVAAKFQKYNIVDMMIKCGAKRTILDAVLLNDSNLVENMLKNGVDPNTAIGYCRVAMTAIKHGKPDVIRKFLDYGVSMYEDWCDNHPLFVEAVKERRADVVELLLDYGADPQRTGKDGLSAAFWAQKINDANILKIMKLT
jgi:ankyrin repeat protein